MPGCLSLFGQRGMAAFSMKDDLTGRFLRACIERNRGTKKQLRQPEKRIIRPTSGTLRLSDRVLPVDGLPLALEAGRGVERRVTWTIEKRKINFGKACW